MDCDHFYELAGDWIFHLVPYKYLFYAACVYNSDCTWFAPSLSWSEQVEFDGGFDCAGDCDLF